jgi:hypothetical protein
MARSRRPCRAGRPFRCALNGRSPPPMRPLPGEKPKGRYLRSPVQVGGRGLRQCGGRWRCPPWYRPAGGGQWRDGLAARRQLPVLRARRQSLPQSHGSGQHHGGSASGTRTPAATSAAHPSQPPAATTLFGFLPSNGRIGGGLRPFRAHLSGRPARQSQADGISYPLNYFCLSARAAFAATDVIRSWSCAKRRR